MAERRSPKDVRREIEQERDGLAVAVEHLRGELGEAADITGRVRARLPALAAGAAGAGFVLAGGVGASLRFVTRRSREGHQQARLGRWSLDRD